MCVPHTVCVFILGGRLTGECVCVCVCVGVCVGVGVSSCRRGHRIGSRRRGVFCVKPQAPLFTDGESGGTPVLAPPAAGKRQTM